jgi:hypothetical protein
MLILRRNLDRPLSWGELDHNLEVLEINEWTKQDYELRQKCFVIYNTCTVVYNCVTSHVSGIYEPADTFITEKNNVTLWEPISSTCGGSVPADDIYVTGMTYNGTYGTGYTLTLLQTGGYPDVKVFVPPYAQYDHYTYAVNLSGSTLNLHRTGGLSTLTVDLQPIINIATGVTHTDTYVTGGTLTGTYHLQLKRNDGGTIDVNLVSLRDGNYYTTGATLSGTVATFNKNVGSSYTLDLSGLVTAGASGYSGISVSGFSGYSGLNGAASSSGYSGISGQDGASGFSGYSGAGGAGTSGLSGYSGTGISGFSGYSGLDGLASSSGYSGINGFSGYSGISGQDGASGFSGYSGISGIDGVGVSGFSGYSGVSGATAASGFSGYSGISGIDGVGVSGFSGYSGVSGATAASGFSGYSGHSGYSGAQGLYGAASLILNGDGACTTDWNFVSGFDPTWWQTASTSLEIINAVSGFVDKAVKYTLNGDFSLPCGIYETSYELKSGVDYSLSFKYRSNVAMQVVGAGLSGNITLASYALTTSTTSGVTMTFQPTQDCYLYFGGGTGSTATVNDWWMLDEVTLRCGSCTGGTATGLTINNNANNRVLTANGSTTSIEAEPNLTFDQNIALIETDGVSQLFIMAHGTGNTGTSTRLTPSSYGGVPIINSVRTKGTKTHPTAPIIDDLLFQQNLGVSFGTGFTTGATATLPIMSFMLTSKANFNVVNPSAASEYKISMKKTSMVTDTMEDRLVLTSTGFLDLYANTAIHGSLSTTITTTSVTSLMGSYMSTAVILTGATVTLTLPRAIDSRGMIFYVTVKSTTGGLITLATATGTDYIGWNTATSVDLADKGDFIMIQSDGADRWYVLSFNGITP